MQIGVLKSHNELGTDRDAGGCPVLHAWRRSLVPTHTSSAVQSLVAWSFPVHVYSHAMPRAGPDPAPAAGPEQTDLFSSCTGCFPSCFQHHVNFILETCCYVRALTWACKNVLKAFIRTTPALQIHAPDDVL